MVRISFAAWLLALTVTGPAYASHESAEAILNQFVQYAPRSHLLQPAQKARPLVLATKPIPESLAKGVQALLRDSFSVIVIEQGEIVSETYNNGAAVNKPLNAYSMAKSLTALAVGEALCAGKIKSLDDLASTYVPALAGTAYGAASLRNLLGYTSGAEDPGGDGYAGIHNRSDFRAMAERTLSLVDLLKKYGDRSRFKQGEKFIYNGLDSEALSVVLRNATGQSLPQWFEATVWQKAGAEFSAGWMVDKDGNGIAEILFFATPRDYARLGVYTLERLTGKSADACMNAFVQESAQPRIAKGYWNAAPRFGLGLHIGADGHTWFFGHSNQRIGMNPRNGRVVAVNGWRDLPNGDGQAQRILGQ